MIRLILGLFTLESASGPYGLLFLFPIISSAPYVTLPFTSLLSPEDVPTETTIKHRPPSLSICSGVFIERKMVFC